MHWKTTLMENFGIIIVAVLISLLPGTLKA
jgi:multisubunit Na+/H+ antiporter MnhE subunit